MNAPIFKVGLVLLRQRHGIFEICLTQIKSKHSDEQALVDFGLPKGTRRYRDSAGNLQDARHEDVAIAQRHALEPLIDTLREEAQQEIGLAADDLARGPLHELGPRMFHSRKGTSHPIHWYVMEASDGLVLGPAPEAHAVRWFTLAEVRALKSRGAINEAYAEAIEEAILRLKDNSLTPIL